MNREEQRESIRSSLKEQFDLLTVAIEGIELGNPLAMDLALDMLKIRRADLTSMLLLMEVPLRVGGGDL